MVCMVRTLSHLYGGVCWWTLPHTNISTVGAGRFPFFSRALYQGIYREKKKRETTPATTVGIPPSRRDMKVTQGAPTDRKYVIFLLSISSPIFLLKNYNAWCIYNETSYLKTSEIYFSIYNETSEILSQFIIKLLQTSYLKCSASEVPRSPYILHYIIKYIKNNYRTSWIEKWSN